MFEKFTPCRGFFKSLKFFYILDFQSALKIELLLNGRVASVIDRKYSSNQNCVAIFKSLCDLCLLRLFTQLKKIFR